jgi:hypothetical protein
VGALFDRIFSKSEVIRMIGPAVWRPLTDEEAAFSTQT